MSYINPFKPNSPVPIGMFAGRIKELELLENGLLQTRHGQSCNYLVTGERGIGKSSLMLYLKHVASGSITSLDDKTFDFITINLSLSEKMSLTTLIKLIESNISRELKGIESIRSFLTSTWEFAQRLKIMDSGIEKAESIEYDTDILLDELSYSLAETCNRITSFEKGVKAKDGILFFIDEADNSSEDLRIGYFFKTITEKLQLNGCENIMFVVAGLPQIVEILASSHESSVRIFHQLKIRELKPEDRYYVIDKGIEKANKQNGVVFSIQDKAKQSISRLSEGYPHFIQQFAYSAFDHNTGLKITDEDVLAAALKEGGAIDSIGSRYYHSFYNEKIKSDEYREVLSIMAEEWNSWIKKSAIREKFSGSESTLTNALQALTTRKIILKNHAKIGEYRLQQRGFALWIKLFGERKK